MMLVKLSNRSSMLRAIKVGHRTSDSLYEADIVNSPAEATDAGLHATG